MCLLTVQTDQITDYTALYPSIFELPFTISTMVLILDGSSEHGKHIRNKSGISRLVKGIWLPLQNCISEKTYFTSDCATCCELPSYINTLSTMVLTGFCYSGCLCKCLNVFFNFKAKSPRQEYTLLPFNSRRSSCGHAVFVTFTVLDAPQYPDSVRRHLGIPWTVA